MPTKIVDLSARSEIIRDEPFHVHFWECTPAEFRKYLVAPRAFLEKMGIKFPRDCRIETTIEMPRLAHAACAGAEQRQRHDRLQRRRRQHRARRLPRRQLRPRSFDHRQVQETPPPWRRRAAGAEEVEGQASVTPPLARRVTSPAPADRAPDRERPARQQSRRPRAPPCHAPTSNRGGRGRRCSGGCGSGRGRGSAGRSASPGAGSRRAVARCFATTSASWGNRPVKARRKAAVRRGCGVVS